MTAHDIRTEAVDEARNKLGTLVQRAGLRGEVTVLTYRGEPAALLVPIAISPERLQEVREYLRSNE